VAYEGLAELERNGCMEAAVWLKDYGAGDDFLLGTAIEAWRFDKSCVVFNIAVAFN
jgi:hypothetical protein